MRKKFSHISFFIENYKKKLKTTIIEKNNYINSFNKRFNNEDEINKFNLINEQNKRNNFLKLQKNKFNSQGKKLQSNPYKYLDINRNTKDENERRLYGYFNPLNNFNKYSYNHDYRFTGYNY